MNAPIAIMTDFGLEDGSVGVMKGVINSIAPGTNIVDISHQVPPQNIDTASFLLSTVVHFFPVETIFLVVVDPGVGSERKGMAGKIGNKYFVCPDNGIITDWIAMEKNGEFVSLENKEYWLNKISFTFHGRDIFAPVASHISNGIPLSNFGAEIVKPVLLPYESPKWADNTTKGRIRYIDHFGNLVTDFHSSLIEEIEDKDSVEISLGDIKISKISKYYSACKPGNLVAVVGGFGYLEIACVNGNASLLTGIETGSEVLLKK